MTFLPLYLMGGGTFYPALYFDTKAMAFTKILPRAREDCAERGAGSFFDAGDLLDFVTQLRRGDTLPNPRDGHQPRLSHVLNSRVLHRLVPLTGERPQRLWKARRATAHDLSLRKRRQEGKPGNCSQELPGNISRAITGDCSPCPMRL
jgi:hypothetical protein